RTYAPYPLAPKVRPRSRNDNVEDTSAAPWSRSAQKVSPECFPKRRIMGRSGRPRSSLSPRANAWLRGDDRAHPVTATRGKWFRSGPRFPLRRHDLLEEGEVRCRDLLP